MLVNESPGGREGGVYLRCVHLGTALHHLHNLAIFVKLVDCGVQQLNRLIILNHWFIMLLPAFDLHTFKYLEIFPKTQGIRSIFPKIELHQEQSKPRNFFVPGLWSRNKIILRLQILQ